MLISGEWMRWTLLSFGRGPDLQRNEPAFVHALRRNSAQASILGLANSSRVRVQVGNATLLPLDNQIEIQMLNRYAPGCVGAIRQLSQRTVQVLSAFTDCLRHNAGTGVSRVHEARIDAAIGEGSRRSAMAVLAYPTHDRTVAPIAYEENGNIVYSASAARALNRVLLNFRPVSGSTMMSKLAGDVFENLLGDLLKSAYTTEVNRVPLLGVGLSPRLQDDIDAIGWNATEIVLVEAKIEAEPPGAWTAANRASRLVSLRSHRSKLDKKVAAFSQALSQGKSTVWTRDGTRVDLPANQLRGLPVRGIVVSVRLEPVGVPGVVTLVSRLAQTILGRRVPTAQMAPLWSGGLLP